MGWEGKRQELPRATFPEEEEWEEEVVVATSLMAGKRGSGAMDTAEEVEA